VLLVLAVSIPTIVGIAIVLGPLGELALPALGATIAIDLILFGAIWLAMRPGPADITSPEQLARLVKGGKPVVVELYSNFCMICMANRQIIKTAATSLSGQCRFVRVELPTAAGQAIGDFYKCRYTPSYLLFDGHGDLVRTIIPDNVTPVANGYRILDEAGAVVSRAARVSPELLVDLVRFTG
jgi:thiol-disulfide isomerase/thioredoxin